MSSSHRTVTGQSNPTQPKKEFARFELPCGAELQERFTVFGKMTEGGMSDVYSGIDLDSGRKIALKLASDAKVPLSQSNRLIERERMALERTKHGNIVSLFGSGIIEDRNYLALELIEGETLEARVKRSPFQWPEASSILCSLCDALSAAHLSGVIHGDFTTNNVSISKERPVLLDFGFVKFMDPSLNHGRTPRDDVIIGTIRYMAPEQTMPGTNYEFDHRADIYAFGVLAYRMLSGAYPLDGESDYEVIMKHWMEQPVPLRKMAPHVPPEAERIVMKALAKNQESRFQSVTELRSAISAA